jgi:phosphoribosyl 1,2-cyclic phosphodiesterase
MHITFWGVRGSIPTPGPDTVQIGGNTSCVEVRAGKALLIFDAGTGLRLLGKSLLAAPPVTAHVFFSHVHWDHIQGFPFFEPAFVAGNTFHMYGRGSDLSRTLEQTLAGQMNRPNFPVKLTEMGAKMTFRDLAEAERLAIDDGDGGHVVVTSAKGNHPQGVLAFRVDHDDKSVVYATDTEHGSVDVDGDLLALARGAHVLIYDSQYTPEEYVGAPGTGGSKKGWGHSTFEEGAKLAAAAGARRLVLFHHDPGQTDAAVRNKESRARALFPDVVAAYEGLRLEV